MAKNEVREDMVGKCFGHLTVLRKSDQKRKNSRAILWECQCECGNICLKPTSELNSGLAKSCGCVWRNSSIHAGEIYGRLIALEATAKRRNGSVVWKCRCIKAEMDKDRFLTNLTYVDNTCIEFLEKMKQPTSLRTTGVRGVTQIRNGKYRAELTFQKKRHYLGNYDRMEDAVKARKQAEIMVEEYL